MKKPVCELCGSHEFTKEGGMFVCQSCGTKYSPEEAKRLVKEVPDNAVDLGKAVHGTVMGAGSAVKDILGKAAAVVADAVTFKPETMLDANKSAADINNYICLGFDGLMKAYKAVEHPTAEQQQELVKQAKSCLAVLASAAGQGSVNHPQAALIYDNCREIVSAVKSTSYYTQNEDGTWKRNSLPFGTDFKVEGVTESWDALYKKHVDVLEQAYIDANPEDAAAREAFEAQAAQLQAELDDLKAEKKGHGFFDFSGKREVKERMEPVKDALNEVQRQINAIDRKATDYAEQCIDQAASAFTRLD